MITVDTETTGLWFSHGTQTFAIGAYDGTQFFSQVTEVNPLTRSRTQNFSSKRWRDLLLSHDVIVMHNASFDLKALCNAGVFTTEEITIPSFWDKIVDTSVLAHLYNSKAKRSLKVLTKNLFDEDYEEDTELTRVTNRCRLFVSNRKEEWLIADNRRRHPSLIPAASNSRWAKMDMWLPATLAKHFDKFLLRDYFHKDYKVLNTILLDYLKADCINTYELGQMLFHEIVEQYGADAENMLKVNTQVQAPIWALEHHGVHIHEDEIDKAIQVCKQQTDALLTSCNELCRNDYQHEDTFTDNQIRSLLYEVWDLPALKRSKKTGSPSVDAKTLVNLRRVIPTDSLQYQFLGTYIAYKKYIKKLQFLDSYKRNSINSYLYPNYNIVGTDTLRFSSSNPNGQNIEKASNPFKADDADIVQMLEQSPSLRSVFGPAEGRWWICMDYSQLQLRIFAVATNETEMQQAFADGWDGHDFTMHRIFSDINPDELTEAHRRISKNVNFGFIFGASPKKIEETAGREGLWDTVTSMFPNAHSFIEETKEFIRSHGHVLTLGQYPLEIPETWNKYRGGFEKKAHAGVNYIVQGTEGEIVKRAMALCYEYLRTEFPEGNIALQVHDEFIFDVPARCSKHHIRNLKRLMEQAATEYGVSAPVDAEVVTYSWNKKTKITL